MDSAAVIINPTAGSFWRRLTPRGAGALLRRYGFEVEISVTRRAREGIELAARAGERHPIVVAAGGDGTVREVACGLLETRAALAVLPCGSGNDFARGMGITSTAQGAAAAGRRAPREIDVAFLGGRPFLNSAGFFASGEVARRAARLPRLLGRARYLLAGLAALATLRGRPASWRFAGDQPPRVGEWVLAEVGNGPFCGGGYRLTPVADPADGLLDFCLIEKLSVGEALRLFPRARRGTHLSSERVSWVRANAAWLTLPEPVAMHLDGEAVMLPAGEHALHLAPRRLRVLAGEAVAWRGTTDSGAETWAAATGAGASAMEAGA